MPEAKSSKKKEKRIILSVKLLKNKKKAVVFFVVLVIISLTIVLSPSLFVAALVNNKPITRLSLVRQLEKSSGQATLENLVVRELILQEAKNKGVTVTPKEIDEEIEKIKEIIESQGSTLETALGMQGQTLEDLKDNIMIQKTAEKILKDDIEVTEEELMEYFEENKEFYEDREYADLKEEIEEQLYQQKLQAGFTELLETLKSDSDIKYLMTF